MKRWFGVLPMLGLLCALVAVQVGAESKDEDGGWSDTTTTFNLLLYFTHHVYPCGNSSADYHSCVELVNGMGGLAKKRMALIPKGIEAHVPGLKYSVVQDYGALSYVELEDEGQEVKSPAELGQRLQTEMRVMREAAESNFKTLRQEQKKLTGTVRTDIHFEKLALDLWLNRKDEVSSQLAIGTAINRMIRVQDGHGRIVPLAEMFRMSNSKGESFGGIGAELQQQKSRTVVAKVVEGSPAQAAGVKQSDIIVSIDKTPIDGLPLSEVVSRLRGPVDSTVTLSLWRDGQTIEAVRIQRKEIVMPNFKAQIVADMGVPMAHLSLKTFAYKDACSDVKQALLNLQSEVKGIIFDVRDNSGGYLDQAVCIGGLFMGRKPILLSRAINNGVLDETALVHRSEERQLTRLPLVVLIDSDSASASEIIAGAVQDNERGFLMGERTFGKATVQTGAAWERVQPDLYLLQTTARFYQPLGHTNQMVGVYPDFEIYRTPNPTEAEKMVLREGDLFPTALPAIGKAWTQTRQSEVDRLNSSCLVNKRAETAFDTGKARDFQLLKAQELLGCMQPAPVRTGRVIPRLPL